MPTHHLVSPRPTRDFIDEPPLTPSGRVQRCREWIRNTRTGPVFGLGMKIYGPPQSLMAELGFTESSPAVLDHCDGCGWWSPGGIVLPHAAHTCGRPTRGWFKTQRGALLAILDGRYKGRRRPNRHTFATRWRRPATRPPGEVVG
jgi:hypothetical protein